MKKNELYAIVKQGQVAIKAEVAKLQAEIQNSLLKATRGEDKNPRRRRTLRRTIAQLLTMQTALNNSSTKDQA